MPDETIHLLDDAGTARCFDDDGMMSGRIDETTCPSCLRSVVVELTGELARARHAPPSLGDSLVAAATLLRGTDERAWTLAQPVVDLAFQIDALVQRTTPTCLTAGVRLFVGWSAILMAGVACARSGAATGHGSSAPCR